MTSTETRDTAGVIAPPPLLALAVVVLGLLLDWLLPAYMLELMLSLTWRVIICAILIAGGLALVPSPPDSAFPSAGTEVKPWRPSTLLVTDGIFAWLRNPMYVGGTLFLAGLSILLASDWMLVMTAVFALLIHFGVVKREERYLEAKFGDAYRSYKARVPRYGIPT